MERQGVDTLDDGVCATGRFKAEARKGESEGEGDYGQLPRAAQRRYRPSTGGLHGPKLKLSIMR